MSTAALVVVDDGLAARWLCLHADLEAYFAHHAGLELAGPVRSVAGGEAAKSGSDTVDAVLGWIAEAVKVGLIRDASVFAWIEEHAEALHAGESTATATMIRRCAELHLQRIATSGDPFERGSAPRWTTDIGPRSSSKSSPATSSVTVRQWPSG